MKTIKELADELGVSKTTIRNHINKLPDNLSVIKKGNTLHLDSDTEAFIKDKVQTVSDNFAEKGLQEVAVLKEKNARLEERIQDLLDENKFLKEQIRKTNEQLAHSTKIVDQGQQLQLLLEQVKKGQEENKLLLEHDQERKSRGFWKNLFNID